MLAEMRRSVRRLFQPLLLLVLVLSSLFSPGLVLRASAQTSQEETLETRYFTIIYPTGEAASAEWYAGFADDVNESVAEMLGNDPLTGLTLHIYATEADYIAANPAAGAHAGIMAHAIPGQLEIGVAVERLRQVAPEIARESFRHEMTHVIAGALSGQTLPIGFQEALAQYNELSIRRAQESAQALRSATDSDGTILSWFDLNDRWVFSQNPDLGYPQAYTVMAFLVERYGMDEFARFLFGMKAGAPWSDAMTAAYRTPVRALEREWRSWLPGFLKDGWQTNLLTYYDMSPGVALYDAGHFDEAVAHFTRSQDLYSQLGRENRVAVAGEYLRKAQQAMSADLKASDARKELEAYNYRQARDDASSAKESFTTLGLTTHIEAADQTLQLAEQGMAAVERLDSARKRAGQFDVLGARSDARAAAEVFATMGDTARASQAAQVINDLSRYSILIGAGVVALGLCVMAIGLLVVMRRRRGKLRPGMVNLPNTVLGKESAEWL